MEVLVVVVRVVVSFVVVSDAVILEVCFLISACSLVFVVHARTAYVPQQSP